MAASWVQTVGGSIFEPGTATVTVTNGGDLGFLFVEDLTAAGRTITISDSTGNPWFLMTPPGTMGFNSGTEAFYYCPNMTVGSHVITISATASDIVVWCFVEYTGAPTSSPFDGFTGQQQSAPGTSVGAITSGTYSAPTTGDTVVGISIKYTTNAAGLVAASGTQRSSTSVASTILVVVEDQPGGGGTTQSTFTDATNGGTDPYITLSAAILPLSIPVPPPLMGQICT